jgi:peptidyl-dipeptidase A
MKKLTAIFVCVFLSTFAFTAEKPEIEKKAEDFLALYNSMYQHLVAQDNDANWLSVTDVTETHTGQRIGADQLYSAFIGDAVVINNVRELLKSESQMDPLTVRQLKRILYNAAHSPGTIPDIVSKRVVAEAKQSSILDSFEFCAEKQGDKCTKVVTPNMIEDVLEKSTDLTERKKIWEVSKQSGVALKPGIVELQKLRNEVAKATGFHSFFDLEVSDYGMTVPEMMTLNEKVIADLHPLYLQLHTWAKYRLAEKYKQPVPKTIPAHWLGNRWSQSWPGLVEGIDMDTLFKDKSKEWIVQQGERFYVSLGMPNLPQTFWTKSDLYELPPNSPRKKNTHATAWHIDLDHDVRSLMSIRPDFQWFTTAHHELGHIYYYLSYARPAVPVTLREGANRAFHEGIGYLIATAARQVPYLKQIGVMPADMKIDQTNWLMDEALENVVFMPWSSGTMTHFEHDLYEENLSPEQYNQRWWQYVKKYQGVEPPEPRGEEYCDACTKTHINDDPAQYYDYALSYVIQYQLHDYIARKILHQDPHNCNYYGNKEVGKFLTSILELGATRDWREVIKEKTGEELSTRAMVEYFQPLQAYLEKQNKGRNASWD